MVNLLWQSRQAKEQGAAASKQPVGGTCKEAPPITDTEHFDGSSASQGGVWTSCDAGLANFADFEMPANINTA